MQSSDSASKYLSFRVLKKYRSSVLPMRSAIPCSRLGASKHGLNHSPNPPTGALRGRGRHNSQDADIFGIQPTPTWLPHAGKPERRMLTVTAVSAACVVLLVFVFCFRVFGCCVCCVF